MRPYEADTGEKATLAWYASVRSSRPPPWSCGPTIAPPSKAFVTTVSAVFTSADLTWAGVQSGWSWSRTAAEPVTWGAAIEVPLKNAQSPSSPQTGPLHGIDERTFTPTDV